MPTDAYWRCHFNKLTPKMCYFGEQEEKVMPQTCTHERDVKMADQNSRSPLIFLGEKNSLKHSEYI